MSTILRPKGSIVFVASQTGSQSDGGLESSTSIFERLASAYDWTFLTSHETRFTRRWRSGGARVVVSKFSEVEAKPVKLIRFLASSLSALKLGLDQRPSLFHANDPRAFQIVAPAATLLNLPLVLTLRDTKAEGASFGRNWFNAASQAKRIVTLSSEMADYFARHIGAPSDKIIEISSIVDLQRFRVPETEARTASRTALRITEDEFAVGCIGVLRDKKNQLEVITKMLPRLIEIIPNAKLHLFGDLDARGDQYARLCLDAVQNLGLQRHVTLHGHTEDMCLVYQALDCVVVGSRNEGLARCMIEGMAAGVPVVSFDVCSAREMLESNGAGVVVPQGDHAGLANAIGNLALKPDARTLMGARGRTIAEKKFDPERIARLYRDLYEKVRK